MEKNEQVPKGYTFIRCHMNFEVKMDFTRKARFVAGGHMTDPQLRLCIHQWFLVTALE
jgi:hypothetical protein